MVNAREFWVLCCVTSWSPAVNRVGQVAPSAISVRGRHTPLTNTLPAPQIAMLPPPLMNSGKTITLPGLKRSARASAGGLQSGQSPEPSPSSDSAGTASHRPGINSTKTRAHFKIRFIAASSLSRPRLFFGVALNTRIPC
jgi:hypothetical protein